VALPTTLRSPACVSVQMSQSTSRTPSSSRTAVTVPFAGDDVAGPRQLREARAEPAHVADAGRVQQIERAVAACLADTLPTLAGRTATVRGCARSQRASRSSPLDAAADVLGLLEPTLAALEQDATRALERAPTGAGQQP
jgi:hypothetical protein